MYKKYRNYWYLTLFANFFVIPPVMGGAPVAYDAWSESAGVVTSSCPSGFTCDEEITGRGMFQRLITNVSGDRYYQQVMADSGGRDGLMKLEAFIYSSNTAVSGLASKQYIEDSDADNDFNSTVFIATGWANQGEDSVDTNQFIVSRDPDHASVRYIDEFKYFQKRDASENNIGRYVDITQGQLDSTLLKGDRISSGEDRYTFVNRIAVGVYTSVAGSVSVNDRYRNSFGGGGGMRRGSSSGTASDGTLNWSAGDELQAIWIGNRCDDCTNDFSRRRDFSFESYENLTTGDGVAGQRGSSFLPESWIDQIFGTTPALIN